MTAMTFQVERLLEPTLCRRMVSSGLLRRVALVRKDVSEEPGASFIRVTKIVELGTTQAATSNQRTLRRNTNKSHTALTTQKTPFFIVTAVKTSNRPFVEFSKLLFSIASKIILVSSPAETHDCIFVLSRLLYVLKWTI
jgi:hypothetical protein